MFITDDLIKIAGEYAQCRLTTAHDLGVWGDVLKEKFNKFTGIKSHRDFEIVKDQSGHVTVKAKSRCYEGAWTDVMEKFVIIGKEDQDCRVDLQMNSYHALKRTTKLSEAKLTDLTKCGEHVDHDHKWFYKALRNENEQYGDSIEESSNSEQNQTITMQVMKEFSTAEQNVMNLKNKGAMKSKRDEFNKLMQKLEVPITTWAPTAKTVKDQKNAIWKKREELWEEYNRRVQDRQNLNLQMQQMAQQMQPIQWQPGQISTYSDLGMMIAQL